ncbi:MULTISPECIES: ABC transporter substrate-binding protein [Bacillales]|uniref:ABC transporter substrate-binding protein n=1 Tax=Bacillales TaxID=1385 RepID=UPI0024B36E3E|nr:ABC transporter substrate-binding protein [Pseudalkalibacillus hwajinpoensis]
MKKLLFVLSIVAVFVLSACSNTENSSSTSSEDGEKPQLNIGYVSILANAPGIVADKNGAFNEKLTAETYGFNSGPELYQALASGDLDVAYAGIPALVNWSSRGLPVKVISKVSEGKVGVVVNKDSGITSVKELKGQVLAGVKSGSGVDIITRGLILPDAGLTPSDLSIQEFDQTNIEPAVDSGQAQAGVLNEPFLTYSLLRGKEQIAEENDPALVVVVSEDALKNKPEAVKAFMDVHQSTIDDLNEDQDKANKVLVDAFNIGEVEDVSPEEVIAKAKEKMTYEWQFDDDDFEYYQQLADAAYDLGYVDKEVDVKKLMDLSVVDGVMKSE